jgi:hypothetical protein
VFDPQKPHICGSGITLIKNTFLFFALFWSLEVTAFEVWGSNGCSGAFGWCVVEGG